MNESLEQLIVKEVESTWINELQRYESLKDDQMPIEILDAANESDQVRVSISSKVEEVKSEKVTDGK